MKFKMWVWICVFVLLTTVTGCKKDIKLPVQSTPPAIGDEITTETPDNHENEAINPLTGLYISKEAALRRPIGIMINNLKAAQPQSGLAQADVIYETLVEGSICRLFAVFQDFDAEKIGPIRSARHYFLDFAFDFDAIYVHYGQSPQAIAAIKKLDPPSLNGLSGLDTIMTYQDPKRVRPHSTYTSFKRLMDTLEYVGYRKEANADFEHKLKFSPEEYTPNSSVQAPKVSLLFSYYSQPWFEYNATDSLYYRYQYNAPQMDVEVNEHLKCKNIIIQITDLWVIPGDSEGRLDMSLISDGTGYYITNNRVVPITWEKTSHESPTRYYLEDGTELLLNPGKTWIEVFPSNRTNYITFE